MPEEPCTGRNPSFNLDNHLLLSVTDNGTVIPEEVIAHIFEPFFSTKESGNGTGLGFATCYGIVEQNEGHIEVLSKPGEGTTFNIYLPRGQEQISTALSDPGFGVLPWGSETVLLVEDEPQVRQLGSLILIGQGYRVLEAENGIEALKLAAEHAKEGIDLLVTDVVMPKMGGKELADRIVNICPNIQVLFTSGYIDDAIVSQGVADSTMNYLQKPFSPEAMALKVRAVLNSQGAGGYVVKRNGVT